MRAVTAMELINLSRFAAMTSVLLDPRAEETLVVVVKGTFAIPADAGDGRPVDLHAAPEPIALADRYAGEPGRSSVAWAGELGLAKPATDVVLLGQAYPRGAERRMADVTLRVGSRAKTVRVFGARTWRRRLGMFMRASDPAPFERLPLCWESAAGGTDASGGKAESDPRNPVGRGFRAKHSKLPVADQPLPQIESPGHLIDAPDDAPPPAGFGFIAPSWQPRVQRAGSYDDAWRSRRAPLLPDDFDPRFHQVAPDDQVFADLPAGTPVEVLGADPTGRLAFALPAVRPAVSIQLGEGLVELPMMRDTVVIDAERRSVALVWRGSLPIHDRVYAVAWIRVGEEGG